MPSLHHAQAIASQQNRHVKNVVKLRRRRHRDRQRLTLVEGGREIKLALEMGVIPEQAFFCPALLDDLTGGSVHLLRSFADTGRTQLFEVTSDVYAKIAVRGESGGLLMVVRCLSPALTGITMGLNPLLAVIENVEKPGNLGAILRTADAAGVDGVIVCGDEPRGTDLFNPNVVRASLGSLFSVPLASAPTADVIGWLRLHGVRMIAVTPNASTPYTEVDMTGSIALVLGSEAHGLTDQWVSAADDRVVIPMQGVVDSLNLAVATALVLFEAKRQRVSNKGGESVGEPG